MLFTDSGQHPDVCWRQLACATDIFTSRALSDQMKHLTIHKITEYDSNLKHFSLSREFRLPPPGKWDIRSSGMLHGTDWWLIADVSEKLIGLIKHSKTCFWTTWYLNNLDPYPTSVTNYQSTLCNIPEEWLSSSPLSMANQFSNQINHSRWARFASGPDVSYTNRFFVAFLRILQGFLTVLYSNMLLTFSTK